MPDVEKVIQKEFGENILISANSLVNRKKQIIPVSPAIDLILGSGIMSGTMNVFAGKPKSGKTSLALYFAATAQQEKYGARDTYYYNIETRIKERDLQCVPGLNLDKFFIIESTQDKILNAADYLDIGHKLISTKPKSIHIFDSFSSISSETEINEGMSKSLMDNGNKIISRFCRKIGPILPATDCIIIIMHHLGVNLSGYGAALVEKSSTAVKYHCYTKLICKSFSYWKPTATSEEIIGQVSKWNCEHSSCGPPGKSCEGYLFYGKSISKEMELLNIAKDLNLVEAAGSWLTFSYLRDILGEGTPKIQGIESARNFLIQNPEYTEILNKKIREMFGLSLD